MICSTPHPPPPPIAEDAPPLPPPPIAEVELPNTDPSAFKSVLQWMYTGDIGDDVGDGLLEIANRYQVDEWGGAGGVKSGWRCYGVRAHRNHPTPSAVR